MLRITLGLAAVAVLASTLRADDTPPRPTTPKPLPLTYGNARVEGESLRCEVVVWRYVREIQHVTVMMDGKNVQMPREVMVPRTFTERRVIPLRDVRAHVTGGKGADPTKLVRPVDAAKLRELLKEGRNVVFAANGQKLDDPDAQELRVLNKHQRWKDGPRVKELKEGTLILVLPAPKPPAKRE